MKSLAQDVAEDVLGAAKDGSDLAQGFAENLLGDAKNGSVTVFIVKVLVLSIVKARAKPLRRCTTRAKPNLRSFNFKVGNLEPQDAQGQVARGREGQRGRETTVALRKCRVQIASEARVCV